MRFTFCPHCGMKLVEKQIGDEGMIPYCEGCKIPLWDMFTTCIIAAVVNENREVALLRQNYVSETNYVCVAGVMNSCVLDWMRAALTQCETSVYAFKINSFITSAFKNL